MERIFTRYGLVTFLGLVCSAQAAPACPWADGTYRIRDRALNATLQINADCSKLVWQIKGLDPVDYNLERTKREWVTTDFIYDLHLRPNGRTVTITGKNGLYRTFRAQKLKN